MTLGEQGNQVSKVADSNSFREQQYVINEDLALSKATNSNEHVFNMQLSYDINQVSNPELWNGNFYTILLYELMKHLASDIKHIKESLWRM